MDKQELWTLAQEVTTAFAPFYRQAMTQAIQESEAPGEWFELAVARGTDPGPVSADLRQQMTPYAARSLYAQRLETLTGLELLERVGDDAYRLTDIGRKTVEGIFAAAHKSLKEITMLPDAESERLLTLLRKIVDATLGAPEPKEKWWIVSSRWTDPGDGASAVAKADQYLTDIGRFRDDAHIAAFKDYGVSGHAWEALTCVWRDDLNTAEALAERYTPYRGYTAEDYAAALKELEGKGWVEEKDGKYQMTKAGTKVREAAEEATDGNFFVGWDALSKDELKELGDLLAKANKKLRHQAMVKTHQLMGELAGLIPGAVREKTAPAMEENGLDQPGFYFALLTAGRWDPEKLSVKRLASRNPYSTSARLTEILANVAEAGFLAEKGAGEYELTDKGRAVAKAVDKVFYGSLAELSTLPEEELAQAAGLMRKISDACLEADEPADKTGITTTRTGYPKVESALANIDQRLDDLNAFRDDVHLAAWAPQDIHGRTWEAFTFVWRGDIRTAEKLGETLAGRGWSVEDYAESLEELVQRGWIEAGEGGFQATEKGKALRQEVENETDRLFFAPWDCLSTLELAQLNNTISRLRDNLQPEEAEGDAN